MFGLMIIRDADPQRDAAACAAIYGPYVSDSVISFEALPPGVDEMAGRIDAAYGWVVAEQEGVTVGYAYGSPHRERAAYRWAADVAVYIDADHHRSGVGRALYTQLFEQLRAIGLWTLCAGDPQAFQDDRPRRRPPLRLRQQLVQLRRRQRPLLTPTVTLLGRLAVTSPDRLPVHDGLPKLFRGAVSGVRHGRSQQIIAQFSRSRSIGVCGAT
jgi:L-amino acid N-acyltransferase YncA